MRYAQIINGEVVNILNWDGKKRLNIPGTLVPVDNEPNAEIGGTLTPQGFARKPETPEQAQARQAAEQAAQAKEAARKSARAKLKAGPPGLTDEELEAIGL